MYTKFDIALISFMLGLAIGGSITATTLENHCKNELYKVQQLKEKLNLKEIKNDKN